MVYLPHWPIPSTLGNKKIDYETVFERANLVLKKLNNPHQKLPPVIHVAGTNGKGSTASLIAKIFECHGYKAHLYTSPHLLNCNERIILNGEKISDNQLFEIMEETRICSDGVDLTFMEAFTIGAFLAFAKNPADVVVVECGMGARIDITNIIEKKLASVITSISLDHTEYLGDSLEKIAFEKAFIVRQNTPLIVARQMESVNKIIKIMADDQEALNYFYGSDFDIEIDKVSSKFDFFWNNELLLPSLSSPALIGEHQYYNFASAIACCMSISDKFIFNYDGIDKAISEVRWPSRLEKIENNLTKFLKNSNSEIWIDGAHNEGGAQTIVDWLLAKNDQKVNFVICGFSRNKCKNSFLAKFKNIAKIIAIRVNGEAYPEQSEKIYEIAKSEDLDVINGFELIEALKIVEKISKSKPVRVVICGSLHLARDVEEVDKIISLNDH